MALGFAVQRRSRRVRNGVAAAFLFVASIAVFGATREEAKAVPATHLDMCCFSTPITVGVDDPFTLSARDASNALVTGYVGTVTFSSTCATDCIEVRKASDNSLLPGDSYTFSAGDAGDRDFKLRWLSNAAGTTQLFSVSQTA